MSQLRNVVSYLWSVADWLDYAGTRCDQIPLVGTAVGYPLHTAASYLRSAAWGVNYASDEIDSIWSQLAQAYNLAQHAYNAVWGTVWQAAQNALSTANNAYNFAAGTVWQTAQSALSTANSAYNFAAGTVWQAAQNALSTANNAWNYASGYLVSLIGDVRRALDYGLSRLDGTIGQVIRDWQAGIASLQAQISQIGSSMLSGADVIGWVADSLGYLTTEAIALMSRNAASFAAPLWSLLEAILKNIQLPER